MNRLMGPHPAICALLLGLGAALIIFCGLPMLGLTVMAGESPWNDTLDVALMWFFFVVGCILWLWGCVVFGKYYAVKKWMALLLGLLTVPGLFLIRLVGRRMTPHAAWALQNPGLKDEKVQRKNYKPMKPLY